MAYGWSRKRRRDRIFERFSEIYQTLEREDTPLRQRLSAEDWSYLKERCDSFQEIGRGMSLSEDQRVLVEKLKRYLDRQREERRVRRREQEYWAFWRGPMTWKIAFKVLEIPEASSDRSIDRAYKRLMREYHPDKGGDADKAKRINQARDFLLKRR